MQSDREKAPASGSSAAPADLFEQVYAQLRRVARERLRGERAGHTLQATALVHEVWMRLVGDQPAAWGGRAQFFAAAAEAMRRILIDHARAKATHKRGGDGRLRARKLSLDVLDLAAEGDSDEILAVDEAISRLEKQDPELARVVQLRFFAGLSEGEAGEVLGVSARTLRREWALARAWLRRELSKGERE